MFKRVRKELAKQHIEENEFDPNDEEEKLAGVFSDTDTDSDSDNSDDEETRRQKKKARKALIAAINAGAGSSSEEEEEQEEEQEEEKGEQTIEIYTCNICPDKQLKNEKQVEIHLQSRQHRRRERYLIKTGQLPSDEQVRIHKAYTTNAYVINS